MAQAGKRLLHGIKGGTVFASNSISRIWLHCDAAAEKHVVTIDKEVGKTAAGVRKLDVQFPQN